jgi:hypothetical protein
MMELNGALWNLYNQGRLPGLAPLHKQLLARIPGTGVVRRPLRRRQGALLDAVTTVLERADCPLRVREIHAAVEAMYGERVPFSSVNEALSTHAHGDAGRFRRLRLRHLRHAGTLSVRPAEKAPNRISRFAISDKAPWMVSAAQRDIEFGDLAGGVAPDKAR